MAGINCARIKVVGVGGAGCNVADWLYKKGLTGAEVICINTDQQHLYCVESDRNVLIGGETTGGLGCGGDTRKGMEAAKESAKAISESLGNPGMVFLIAGLGGGTGTGAAPVIARLAKETGAIVIGTVTIPFSTEGSRREKAEIGMEELGYVADTVIVVDNNKMVELAGDLPFQQAFSVANELLSLMIKGVIEIITVPSLVNLDYADVKAVMGHGGVSAIGLGESDSQNRVREAVSRALNHPLLEVNYEGAQGALVHITGGPDLTLNEVNEAGKIISKMLHEDADVVWGARLNNELKGVVRIMTIITGVDSPQVTGIKKNGRRGEGINGLGIDRAGGGVDG